MMFLVRWLVLDGAQGLSLFHPPKTVRPATHDLSFVERSLATERDACGTGFVAEAAAGTPASRRVVELALSACECVEHRGACGADDVSGDGAGILTSIPWAVYEADTPELKEFRAKWPQVQVGCATMFLPDDEEMAGIARSVIESCADGAGFDVVGHRVVPVDPSVLGSTAKETMPLIEQFFFSQRDTSNGAWVGPSLERALYLLRRAIRGAWIRAGGGPEDVDSCYVVSCSSKTVVYKAMCRSAALRHFYTDLDNDEFKANFCIYHRRFSTNTMPRWSLAQPFRLLAHNGEINTIRGNVNWMAARAKAAGDDLGVIAAGCRADERADEACAFVDALALGPVVDAAKSDSANLDASCELYTRAGRSVAEALLLMIPPAQAEGRHDPFLELHAPLQEAWDGPAGICFADGDLVGARLDRNGLRPARFTRYDDGLVCVSSETGAAARREVGGDPWLPADAQIVERGRLGPGEMAVVDLNTGGFFDDASVRKRLAAKPYWADAVKRQRRSRLEPSNSYFGQDDEVGESLTRRQAAFGWGAEDVELQVKSMVTGKEPTLCMGADAPLAVLSKFAHPVYSYLKQRHAQVTNPPMDPIREGHVMSLRVFLGERENCVDTVVSKRKGESSPTTRVVEIDSPVVNSVELERLVSELDGVRLDTTYDSEKATLVETISSLVDSAVAAVRDQNAMVLVLTDESFDPQGDSGRLYVPPLIAVGAVHHALIEAGLRLQASIVVETGQCWSTHHLACLVGYGASAVHPYLLFQEVRTVANKRAEMSAKKRLRDVADDTTSTTTAHQHPSEDDDALLLEALDNTRAALNAGLLKIMSKMGISELMSYHGAQIFEAIGLGDDVVDVALRGTATRIGGARMEDIEAETAAFVDAARGGKSDSVFKLENYGFATALGGSKGEVHANSPKVARLLHAAVREDDPEKRQANYQAFVEELSIRSPIGLRDLLNMTATTASSQAEVVGTVEDRRAEILRRFVTGGMSLGALSRETHETLAIAMNRLGGASNSGEGGEDSARNTPITTTSRESDWNHLRGPSIGEGDVARSKIRQVASGRFGVSADYLAAAQQIEIKIAQGAKPGEGGQLPGMKVDSYIASIRMTPVGVGLISPPPHHDIYSIEDLAQLIFDLKSVAPHARVSVKLVSIIGVGTVACGVAKAGADVVQISGHDGGTGAAPLTSIKHAGAPVELGLVEAHNQLVDNGLRDRVTLRVDGGIRTGTDVVKLALLGGEEFGFGTAAMISAGCVMARVCHTGGCPVGVATQRPDLRERFRGEPQDVVRYLELVADETRHIVENVLGLSSLTEAIGRVDLLEALPPVDDGLAKRGRVDVSAFILSGQGQAASSSFVPPATPRPVRPLLTSNPGGEHPDDSIVAELLAESTDGIVEHVDSEPRRVTNDLDRAVGTRLSGAMATHDAAAAAGIQQHFVSLKYHGSAGQSFGAFLRHGISLELEGDSNDYVGKGLSGGSIAIRPHSESEENGAFVASESVILGNTCLYGATSGKLFAAGRAGDRFAVRNSGAVAVVEGSGDHLCEYMTGGMVVSLGPTGINVGAGMSAGAAFLYADPEVDIDARLSSDVVARPIADADSPAAFALKSLVEAHHAATGSRRAETLLADPNFIGHFRQVLPRALLDDPLHSVTNTVQNELPSSQSAKPVSAR